LQFITETFPGGREKLKANYVTREGEKYEALSEKAVTGEVQKKKGD